MFGLHQKAVGKFTPYPQEGRCIPQKWAPTPAELWSPLTNTEPCLYWPLVLANDLWRSWSSAQSSNWLSRVFHQNLVKSWLIWTISVTAGQNITEFWHKVALGLLGSSHLQKFQISPVVSMWEIYITLLTVVLKHIFWPQHLKQSTFDDDLTIQ